MYGYMYVCMYLREWECVYVYVSRCMVAYVFMYPLYVFVYFMYGTLYVMTYLLYIIHYHRNYMLCMHGLPYYVCITLYV